MAIPAVHAVFFRVPKNFNQGCLFRIFPLYYGNAEYRVSVKDIP